MEKEANVQRIRRKREKTRKLKDMGYNRWWPFSSNSTDEISTFNNNHTAAAQSQRVCFYLLAIIIGKRIDNVNVPIEIAIATI